MPEFRPLLQLGSLDGRTGFRLDGEAAGDESGGAVAAAGDVNGDGFADVIIGAEFANPGGAYEGASYVVFGKQTGFASGLALSSLNGSNGFQISGEGASDFAGARVASAGDVNGDAFADVIVGAPFAALDDAGAAYVVFGTAGRFPSNLQLSSLDGRNGFKLMGAGPGDESGSAVASAGDVNGDGFADLIVGAGKADANGKNSGATYVVFGHASGFPPKLPLSSLDGRHGFRIAGEAAFDASGGAAASAGDVNGDGFSDVIIGARAASPNGLYSGAAYVVFGKAAGFPAELQLGHLDGGNGFKISGAAAYDYCGVSVASAGDINGDGFSDLVIGAYRADANGYNSGASYVVFGRAGGFAANLEMSRLNGTNGFQIMGGREGDASGQQVAPAGDVNGDGFADLAIAAPLADPNGNGSGASYVVFGKAAGFPASLQVSSLNGGNGFRIAGEAAFDASGGAAASAGDVNGDGYADVVIGARDASPNGLYSGAAYVVFGKAAGFPAKLRLAGLDGSTGFTLAGEDRRDFAGTSVAPAGDVDGDGFADVVIGARGVDPNGSYSGASYVVFGHRAINAVNRLGTPRADTINGGRGDDTIRGLGGDDRLIAWEGNDWVSGGNGRDRLNGRSGNDRLFGGASPDVLIGGSGHDVFDFNAVTDSGASEDTRDIIRDFTHLEDRIDLSGLGHLVFIGAAPFTCPGQVRVVQQGPNAIVEVNLYGDAAPEMTIALQDVAAASLSAQDFIL
jgi:hypothetical protein